MSNSSNNDGFESIKRDESDLSVSDFGVMSGTNNSVNSVNNANNIKDEITGVSDIESSDEGDNNIPEADEEKLVEPEQDLTELVISAEMVGIVYCWMQFVRAKVISAENAADYLAQFYKIDTGKFLKPTQLQAVINNKAVKDYCAARHAAMNKPE